MNKGKQIFTLLSALMIAVLVLTACPAPTPN